MRVLLIILCLFSFTLAAEESESFGIRDLERATKEVFEQIDKSLASYGSFNFHTCLREEGVGVYLETTPAGDKVLERRHFVCGYTDDSSEIECEKSMESCDLEALSKANTDSKVRCSCQRCQ